MLSYYCFPQQGCVHCLYPQSLFFPTSVSLFAIVFPVNVAMWKKKKKKKVFLTTENTFLGLLKQDWAIKNQDFHASCSCLSSEGKKTSGTKKSEVIVHAQYLKRFLTDTVLWHFCCSHSQFLSHPPAAMFSSSMCDCMFCVFFVCFDALLVVTK